jgi:ribosomal protein S18 acetylase RimI-like enzyme
MESGSKHGILRKLSFIEKREILRRFAHRTRGEESGALLRPLRDTDAKKIQEVLEGVKAFTPEEISVATSLVDEALRGIAPYRFLVAADQHDTVLGYICYGQAPMTSGTWDIYWIAVSKGFQRRRIGALLLRGAEEDIRSERGRLILIETSTKPSYRSTRKFYQGMGYRVSAKIDKFYSERDDKLIYSKYLIP